VTDRVELLGVSAPFALFGNPDGMSVVVRMDNLSVFDPQPLPSVHMEGWGHPEPDLVPTEVWDAAGQSLSTARTVTVQGTDVVIAAAKPDRRAFAIPRAVQEEAARGLRAQATVASGTEVGLTIARTLAAGGSVGMSTIRHIGRYFERNHTATPAMPLWGGDAGQKWAFNILRREFAVLAAAPLEEPEPALAQPVAPPELASELPTEDPQYSPEEPHPFLPDPALDYLCTICGGDEVAMVHVSEETSADPAPGTVPAPAPAPAPVAASGHEEDRYYATIDEFGLALDVFSNSTHDGWVRWDRDTDDWLECSSPARTDVIPIDIPTAATLSTRRTADLSLGEINPDEQALYDAAFPMIDVVDDVPDEVDLSEIPFAVRLTEEDMETPEGLFIIDDQNTCWEWMATGSWEEMFECPTDVVMIEPDAAFEIAVLLASDSELDPDEIEEAFEQAGVIADSTVEVQDRMGSSAEWDWEDEGAFSFRQTITAATPPPADQEYTPEERSKNASAQFRDAMGRFAKVGAIVTDDQGGVGQVTGIDPENKQVRLKDDKGRNRWVAADSVTKIGQAPEVAEGEEEIPRNSDGTPKLDLEGIQAQPRATKYTPKAWLDKTLPIMDAPAIKTVISNYQRFIDAERARKLKDFALTPDNSDVPPLHLAVVDELDNSAVIDLIALVPKSKTNSQPTAWVRQAGGWEEDPDMMRRIQSVNPPPLVTLDEATYQTVLTQVDSFFTEKRKEAKPTPQPTKPVQASIVNLWDEDGRLMPSTATDSDAMLVQALIAAGVPGIADTPSDVAAARQLKRYWLHGEGAAKVRWGTPGDWTRCVRHLTKYMGDRSKGYCQNLHKDATGIYTGDRRNPGRRGHGLRADGGPMLLNLPTEVLGAAPHDDVLPALAELQIPTVSDLTRLSDREYGHALRVGERFLVTTDDGVFALHVLDPAATMGWQGTPAALIQPYGGQTTLLMKAGGS
jgi:hypothetical protein